MSKFQAPCKEPIKVPPLLGQLGCISQISSQKLLDALISITNFDLAVITSVNSDGNNLWQEALTVLSKYDSPFAIDNGAIWRWSDGACISLYEESRTYVESFQKAFPDSSWAEKGLGAFLSFPVVDDEKRLRGTIALLNRSAGEISEESWPVVQLLLLALAGEMRKNSLGVDQWGQRSERLLEIHEQAINSLSAIVSWSEKAVESDDPELRRRANEVILRRSTDLRGEINALLLANTIKFQMI